MTVLFKIVLAFFWLAQSGGYSLAKRQSTDVLRSVQNNNESKTVLYIYLIQYPSIILFIK